MEELTSNKPKSSAKYLWLILSLWVIILKASTGLGNLWLQELLYLLMFNSLFLL